MDMGTPQDIQAGQILLSDSPPHSLLTGPISLDISVAPFQTSTLPATLLSYFVTLTSDLSLSLSPTLAQGTDHSPHR